MTAITERSPKPTPRSGTAQLLSPLDLANQEEVIKVLESSLYPGASRESIALVISYCRFNDLDPLKKPVHIVPMNIKMMVPNPSYKEGTASPKMVEQTVKRDVIMPGVGLYRTDASRAGTYIGLSEPEFGPAITRQFGNISVTFPEWCRMTAKKLVSGMEAEFTHKEFWLENYATAGSQTDCPNAMWRKRPYGQLAKCTEAQLLRKGWPETVGAAPTAEEMEGKTIGEDELADLNAQTSRTVDATRARTENLRRELGTVDQSKVIDVTPVSESAETEPLKTSPPAAANKPNGGPQEPPPGVPASVGETVPVKPSKSTPPPAQAETSSEPVLPLVTADALILDGMTFPTNVKSTGTKDRITFEQYEKLKAQCDRLGLELTAETQRVLGLVPDDLSREAAKVFHQWLEAR